MSTTLALFERYLCHHRILKQGCNSSESSVCNWAAWVFKRCKTVFCRLLRARCFHDEAMPLLKKRPHGASVVGAAVGRASGSQRASGSKQHISLDCSSDSDYEDDKENTPAVPAKVVSRGASAPFKVGRAGEKA